MLATQCAVWPCASARSRSALAQAAAPSLRALQGLAAAPHSARCRRKCAGAVFAATPRRRAGAVFASTPRRLVTTCGLPIVGGIPVIGPLLSSPLVTVAWAIGGFKLFTGFSKTTYTDALLPKLALCALWCAHAGLNRATRYARSVSLSARAFGRRAR